MAPPHAALASISRTALLLAAGNRPFRRLVEGHGLRFGASRFVAGETLDECVSVLRTLNAEGLWANTTFLGETEDNASGAAAVVDVYEHVLDRLVAEGLRANVALKLTHLGLSFDEETAYANVERLVAQAGRIGSFVRLDMEGSATVDATLRTYERLRGAGHESVGLALQAYLFRTPDDLARILPLAPNVRIVKGAYLEPANMAYEDKRDVDAAYLWLVQRALGSGAYVCVATHDERLISAARKLAERRGITRDRFEFQMLYGVRPALQRRVASEGYKVLVATPYGPDWYPYFMRRLAERPANVAFFVRSMARG
jgi:proline dehydrogenase